jgi:hypothetical protein
MRGIPATRVFVHRGIRRRFQLCPHRGVVIASNAAWATGRRLWREILRSAPPCDEAFDGTKANTERRDGLTARHASLHGEHDAFTQI